MSPLNWPLIGSKNVMSHTSVYYLKSMSKQTFIQIVYSKTIIYIVSFITMYGMKKIKLFHVHRCSIFT